MPRNAHHARATTPGRAHSDSPNTKTKLGETQRQSSNASSNTGTGHVLLRTDGNGTRGCPQNGGTQFVSAEALSGTDLPPECARSGGKSVQAVDYLITAGSLNALL